MPACGGARLAVALATAVATDTLAPDMMGILYNSVKARFMPWAAYIVQSSVGVKGGSRCCTADNSRYHENLRIPLTPRGSSKAWCRNLAEGPVSGRSEDESRKLGNVDNAR